MKVHLTANRLALRGTRHQHKLAAVKYLLNKKETCTFLDKLAEYLLLPDSYLISLPASLLASLIEQTFALLANKTKSISIQQAPLTADDQLLLLSCPDTPYLIDSILTLQHKLNIPFQLLAHPVIVVQRQESFITHLNNEVDSGAKELLIVLRLKLANTNNLSLLEDALEKVTQAALQWDQSGTQLSAKLDTIKSIDRLDSVAAFINWLNEKAFIPFSYQAFVVHKADKLSPDTELSAVANEGMEINISAQPDSLEQLNKILTRDADVIVQSLPIPSPIIRHENLVYIGFREHRNDDTLLEHGFFGLFNESELNGPACNVPELCEKVTATLDNLKVQRNSYDFMQLEELFNLFPKIELFFTHETQLQLLAQSLRRYLFRPDSIKLMFLSSASPFRISALIIIPQALLRESIDKLLLQALCRELSCSLESSRIIFPGGHYTGLQLCLIPEHEDNQIDVDYLERLLNRLARPWILKFRLLLERSLGKANSVQFWARYQNAFSVDYQTLMPPRNAILDLLQIEQLLKINKQQISLLNPCRQLLNYRLHFYSEQEYFLDKYIPLLENLNLHLVDQVQFSVYIDNRKIYIKSFVIKADAEQTQPLHRLRSQMLDTILAILDGKAENDPLNALIVLTGMTWKEIDVLRAYRNYYLQLGYQSTIASIHQALTSNPQVATSLYNYFEARFRPDPNWNDPSVREEEALFPLRLQLLEKIETVTDINSDRILRTLFNLIDATVRSNFHVRRDLDDYFFAFKINSLGIIEMPAPRPKNEIYVHAVDMEGIHLRGGKVSRGGIRWSDRPDDFRTEILGLMQTQMSKNALIIPRGAKGGFVVKTIHSNESFRDAGKRAYITLMHGLLDLTDNYAQEKVIRLPGIVTYDGNDPYLVVAADKGTAQFPDIANAAAAEYKFWLKDAFASGGSQGYNHKALGITARGAWESVKRHFREQGQDIQTEPFTVVGIGSMDGDVFGNGMLLSRCIKLLTAISGLHIFIDPNPNPKCSFTERQRLFDLPGSSWDDYDRQLISAGGGVYRRDDKDIPLSPEVRKWLGIRYRSLDGESLIRYLLAAKVDLLWLGGIGTYVKASTEQHEDAGDRSNDEVRIDALDVRAGIVGEGANLGFTQKARIEYCLSGGRINTDAIDNSAGVDISDHEVNLKILLYDLQKNKHIADYQKLFIQVTDEVCQLVLKNNYAQSLCLSLDQKRCKNNVEPYLQLAERLESAGFLDRTVESFPQNKIVLARTEHVLTRPELAVLMAGSKILLTQLLKEQHQFITTEYCDRYLEAYFPERIRREYNNYLNSHPLAGDIKATLISNQIINQAGCSFLAMSTDNGNNDLTVIIACYLAFDLILDGNSLRHKIYSLDNQIETDSQYQLLLLLENTLANFCRQAMQREQFIQPTAETITCYQGYLVEYAAFLDHQDYVKPRLKNQEQLVNNQQSGIPEQLAHRIKIISKLEDFLLLVNMTAETDQSFKTILTVFSDTLNFLELNTVYEQLAMLRVKDPWEQKVMNDLTDNMKIIIGKLVINMLESGQKFCSDYLTIPDRKRHLNGYQQVYKEIKITKPPGLLPYIALEKKLKNLLG